MWAKLMEKLFHQHEYVYLGFRQVYGEYMRYSMRKYKCQTCGKVTEVDGRRDHIGG